MANLNQNVKEYSVIVEEIKIVRNEVQEMWAKVRSIDPDLAVDDDGIELIGAIHRSQRYFVGLNRIAASLQPTDRNNTVYDQFVDIVSSEYLTKSYHSRLMRVARFMANKA